MPASKAPKKPASKAAPKAKAPAHPAHKPPAKPGAAAPKAAAGAKAAPTAKPGKPLAKGAGAKPTGLSSMGPAGAAGAAAGAEADPTPMMKMEKLAEGTLCQIEILKDGHFFIARTQTESGQAKEYKNTVFEDLLTEMLITLQEQLTD